MSNTKAKTSPKYLRAAKYKLSSVALKASCRSLVFMASLVTAAPLLSQLSPIVGKWQEPSGSIIGAEMCGEAICLRILTLGRTAPSAVDLHNPDPMLRGRSFCNLQIGSSFRSTGSAATGGQLYDPKSGKTYRGTLALEGIDLKLRGYIGIPAFGRTEVWHRFIGDSAQCKL